jgi:hypothetical protein
MSTDAKYSPLEQATIKDLGLVPILPGADPNTLVTPADMRKISPITDFTAATLAKLTSKESNLATFLSKQGLVAPYVGDMTDITASLSQYKTDKGLFPRLSIMAKYTDPATGQQRTVNLARSAFHTGLVILADGKVGRNAFEVMNSVKFDGMPLGAEPWLFDKDFPADPSGTRKHPMCPGVGNLVRMLDTARDKLVESVYEASLERARKFADEILKYSPNAETDEDLDNRDDAPTLPLPRENERWFVVEGTKKAAMAFVKAARAASNRRPENLDKKDDDALRLAARKGFSVDKNSFVSYDDLLDPEKKGDASFAKLKNTRHPGRPSIRPMAGQYDPKGTRAAREDADKKGLKKPILPPSGDLVNSESVANFRKLLGYSYRDPPISIADSTRRFDGLDKEFADNVECYTVVYNMDEAGNVVPQPFRMTEVAMRNFVQRNAVCIVGMQCKAGINKNTKLIELSLELASVYYFGTAESIFRVSGYTTNEEIPATISSTIPDDMMRAALREVMKSQTKYICGSLDPLRSMQAMIDNAPASSETKQRLAIEDKKRDDANEPATASQGASGDKRVVVVAAIVPPSKSKSTLDEGDDDDETPVSKPAVAAEPTQPIDEDDDAANGTVTPPPSKKRPAEAPGAPERASKSSKSKKKRVVADDTNED